MNYNNTPKRKEYIKRYNEENKEKLRLRRQEWYQKTKETRKIKHKEYYENNYEIVMLNSYKQRARKLGVEFNLTLEDITFPEFCPVLGLKLERSKGCVSPNSPSLDRIDPTKGYTKGNIQAISYKANAMKNNATQEELEMFAKWILKEKT